MSCVKNISLADLSESQYLFEILQASHTVKKVKENVVKSRCFKKYLKWRALILFQNKGGI